jgi:hypothetical protein
MGTRAEQAIKGLDLTMARGVVRVCDGEDTWLCWQAEWDLALGKMLGVDAEESDSDDDGAEAYTALCRAVRGSVASLNGTSRGNLGGLLDAAFAGALIDEDMLSALVQ